MVARLRRAVTAIVGVLALYSTANAAGPSRPFSLGLWAGGVYTDDKTGVFLIVRRWSPIVAAFRWP